ncbi:MAG: prepilin-type N-terminal cleavage/methylation domain-containing protein [Bryobacteraceae bacterium]
MMFHARRARRGFSLIELLIVIAIILIIAAIAAPKLNIARMQAQEMAAIRTITTLHLAQTSYYSQFGRNAESLLQLGPPSGGGQPGPAAADLISADLAAGQKSGYVFAVTPAKDGYTVTAVPQVFGQSGRRTFFSDQTLVVRENWGQEPATVQSKEIK